MWAHEAKGGAGDITSIVTTSTSQHQNKEQERNDQKALQEGVGKTA